jgi:integrase
MPDEDPSSPAFLAAYATATGNSQAPQAVSGSIAAGVTAFLASDRYLGASKATRALWRRAMDDIRTRYGSARLADLEARHIRADIGRKAPNPAITRLKAWRAACQWWAEVGLAPRDASDGIKRPKAAVTDGHQPWTREDVATFRRHWPTGSAERLAFELAYWTGARVSDLCQMSETMIVDGWMTFTQRKTRGVVQIPIYAPAPDWAEPDMHLAAELAARPRHIMLMVTTYGKPRTVAGASQWFAAAARAAGIEGKAAHGLRKLRAIVMAENGATTHQIAAWTGHDSLSEVARYSRKADRKRIISGTKEDARSDNFLSK